MSKTVKVLALVAGLLIVAVVALIILVQTQLTPALLRQSLLPVLEEKLQRDVDFGAVEIGLLSGVSIADLKVSERDSGAGFVEVGEVRLSYRLWALLQGKIEINQVALKRPRIEVAREADGRFNFSDLIGESPGAASQAENAAKVQGGAPELPFNLLVKEVSISDGALQFIDRYRDARSPYRYQLDNFNLKATEITLEDSFPFELALALNGSKLDVSGHYSIADGVGDCLVHLAGLDLVQLAPYYRDMLPFKLGAGQLSTNIAVEFKPDQVSTSGRIGLEQLDLTAIDYPDIRFSQAKFETDYALTYDLNGETVEISKLDVAFNGIKTGLQGNFNLGGAEPLLKVVLSLNQLDLRTVMQNVPEPLIHEYLNYSLAGMINGRLEIAGKPSSGAQLLRSARIELGDVQVSAQNIRGGISGQIDYADQKLVADNLVLNYGGNEVNLKLTASDLLGKRPQGNFTLTATEIDLNRLTATAGDASAAPREAGEEPVAGSEPAEEIGPIDVPLDLTGRVAIDRVLYKKVTLKNLTADVSLKQNKLKISNIKTETPGSGVLQAESLVDLNVPGLAYQGSTSLSQPDFAALMNGLLPTTDQAASGRFEWKNSFSGRGTLPDALLKALQLDGNYQLQEGKIDGGGLLTALAGFLGYPELKTIAYDTFAGDYVMRDGQLQVDSALDGSTIKMFPKGTVGINGDLNLALETRLAPELVAKLGRSDLVTQTLTDAQGWGILPLKIKGTLKSPSIGLDSTLLKQRLADKAKEKVAEKILERVGGSSSDSQEPTKQLLDGALKKLFGN